MSIFKKESNQIQLLKSFNEYVISRVGNNDNYIQIMDNGKRISQELNGLVNKKTALLVGNVQSGKTMNFLSVIANSYSLDYKTVIIFTSLDEALLNQTYSRLKESFNYEKNKAFVKIYKVKDLNNNANNLVSEYNKNSLQVIVSLKNPNNISKIKNLFNKDSEWSKSKILIIDDEGDLASLSFKKKELKTGIIDKKYSKANESISYLVNNFSNIVYLSVTATPQAQLLIGKEESLSPERIFTIKPGNNYYGIDYFSKHKDKFFYQINNAAEKESINTYVKDLKKSIYYYLLSYIDIVFSDKNIQEGDELPPKSSMLIHTDVRMISHDDIKNNVEAIIQNLISYNNKKNDFSFENEIKLINEIILENDFNNIKNVISNESKIIDDLIECAETCKILIINNNQKGNIGTINTDYLPIYIGSKMLERGITFNNLIVSFFINSPKSQVAIDTMLQRCRWFGYRKEVEKHMKIFTTEKIINQFCEIAKHNNDVWNKLMICDKDKIPFYEFEQNFYFDNDTLKPTNKVPTTRDKLPRSLYFNYVENSFHNEEWFEQIINRMKLNNNKERISNRDYLSLDFSKKEIIEFDKQIVSEICSIEETQLNRLIDNSEVDKSYKFVYMNYDFNDNSEKPHKRKCFVEGDNKYRIQQLFNGMSENYNKILKNYDDAYIGDINWNQIDKYKNTIFFQIHKVKCVDENDNEITTRYFLAIVHNNDIVVYKKG